jgi:outer membrane protein insertion porin family
VFRPPIARSNIAEVRFTGNEVLPSAVLIRTLSGVAVGLPYNEPGLRAVLDSSIRPLYDARGRIRATFPSITVEKSTAKDVEGIIVTVAVNEGPSYSLGNIRFAGVAQTQVAELEKTANWKHDDIVNFDDIKEGIDRIQHRLRRAGYLRVSSQVDREIHDDKHTVDLLLTIKPGSQFMFGKLTIVGLDVLSEPPIRKMWGDHEGKPFDAEFPDAFLKDIKEQDLFDNLGQTRAETHIDEAAKTVAVTLYFPPAGPATPKDRGRGGGRGRF